MIRTTWLLWRLLRELHIDTPPGSLHRRACELRIIVEPMSSYEGRCLLAEKMGLPRPPRDSMYEVSYWPVAGQPCATQRGVTLAQALKRALSVGFPAALS